MYFLVFPFEVEAARGGKGDMMSLTGDQVKCPVTLNKIADFLVFVLETFRIM